MKKAYLLLGIILIGFSIRVCGLHFGIPEFYAPDEDDKIKASEQLAEKQFKHTNRQPSFLYNSLFLFYKTYDGLDALYTKITGKKFVNLSSKTIHHYLGRLLMVIFGTCTLIPVFLVAKRIFNDETAYITTFLLAVVPIHVISSQYIKEDVLLVFWIMITMLFYIRIIQQGTWIDYILAGFFTGVTISTKYTGILLIPFLGMAHILKINSKQSPKNYLKSLFTWKIWVGGLMIIIGFILTSPIVLFHLKFYIEGFITQKNYGARGHHDGIAIGPWEYWWLYYFKKAIAPGLTLPIVICSILGLFQLLFIRRKKETFLIGIWILVFYLVMESGKAKPYPFYARYILPLIPFLCMCAAIFIEMFIRKIRELHRRKLTKNIYLTVLFGILFFPLLTSLRIKAEIIDDTRNDAYVWMKEHLPQNCVVVSASRYDPPVPMEKLAHYYLAGKGVVDLEKYITDKPTYFTTNSFQYQRYLDSPEDVPDLTHYFKSIHETYRLIKEFRPDFITYGFHNPVVRIYQLESTKIRIKKVSLSKTKLLPGSQLTVSLTFKNHNNYFTQFVLYRPFLNGRIESPTTPESYKLLSLAPGEEQNVTSSVEVPEIPGRYAVCVGVIYDPFILKPGDGSYYSTIGERIIDRTSPTRAAKRAIEEDPPGYLMYGPYMTLEPGNYQAFFMLKTASSVNGPNTEVAIIDIAANDGKKTLVEKKLSTEDISNQEYRVYTLPFSIEETDKKIEFRVLSTGIISLDCAGLVLLGNKPILKETGKVKIFRYQYIKVIGDPERYLAKLNYHDRINIAKLALEKLTAKC